MIPLVDLRAQYCALKPEIEAAVARVLENAEFILGPAVAAFEKDFAAYIGTTEAVGVGELVLEAHGAHPNTSCTLEVK